MIVIPETVITAAAATATPLTHTRIGYHTWLRDLEPASVTVSSEEVNCPKDAPLREDTFEFWQPTALPATWEVNLGAGRSLDYAGLVGRFTGLSIKAETSTNGVDWTALASEVAPSSDAPLVFLDTARVASRVRYTFAAGIPGAKVPQLAVSYAGLILPMQRSIYGGHTPVNLAKKTERYQAFSRGGHFLGQAFRSHGVATSIGPFRFLTPTWVRSDFEPFIKAAKGAPYFLAWRPATYPLEVGFVWTEDDIRPANMGKRDFMQVAWDMQGVGWEN